CQSRKSGTEICLERSPYAAPSADQYVSVTIRSGPAYGSGLRITAWTTLKTAVLAPMPSAMTSMPVPAAAAFRRSVRSAYARSWRTSSSQRDTQTARVSSLTSATLPNASIACRCASSGVIPWSMFSCVWRSRCSRMSSSRSSSARRARFIALLLRRRTKDARDGSSERVPLARFDLELFAALRGQSIELGAAIVLRRAVVERNPAAFDQPVKRRVEGPLLHTEHVIRSALDRFGNGVSVRRSPPQCPQHQEIQRALQELDSAVAAPGRHSRRRG